MKKRKEKWVCCFFALVFFLVLAGCKDRERSQSQPEQNGSVQKFTNTDFAMGTVISQTVYTKGENQTASYVEKLQEIENNLISWRVENSEIDKINQSSKIGARITLSDKTASYLRQTLLLAEKSEGKLDPTIGNISRLWNIDGEESSNQVPEKKEIEKLLENVGYEKINQEENQIYLQKGASIDLGAVGKGIGCDEIYTLLKAEKEVTGAVISVGGSILTYGQKEDGSSWTVAVTDPRDENGGYLGTLKIEGDKFVSTSGDYEKYFIENGERYHHIIDPDTGYPAKSGLISVTAVCDSGLLSDGLSTACFVLGKEKGMELLEQYGAEGIFVDENKNVYMTGGIETAFSITAEGYEIKE